jgi:hypothetical protein
MSNLTIVTGDDWQGLYKDGTLFTESHRLTPDDIADVLGITIVNKEANQEWLEENGKLPYKLSDVKER